MFIYWQIKNSAKNIVSVKASKFWGINTHDVKQYEYILWNFVDFVLPLQFR